MALRASLRPLLLLLLRGPGAPGRGLASEGPQEPLPVIRVPQPLQLRRAARARSESAARAVVPRPGPLLIAARRPELSQPLRLTLGRWECAPLASRGWKHRRSYGDHFCIERTHHRAPALLPEEAEAGAQGTPGAAASFAALGLQPRMLEALQQAAPAVVRPTWVQVRATPPLLQGRHLLCAAETGSGKTLGYLLPLLQRLLARPRLAAACPAPRGLVLVPSRELTEQVRAVAVPLGRALELYVRDLGGGRGLGTVRRQLSLQPPADVLVATPGALWKALRRQLVSLAQLCFLVLDEADTLLDESFLELVEYIVDKSPIAQTMAELEDPFDPKAQLVLVGATFPEGMGALLSKVTDLRNLTTITSPRLHCIMPHVKQKFLRVKGMEKVTELIQALKLHGDQPAASRAVLVFCNTSSTVNWLGYILDDHKIQHLRLQGQMPAAMRAGIFQSFQNGTRDVLLCTDIASRGLDSTRVELVINYDFPLTLQDYIHRAGRVGRVGSEVPGSVLSFVTHPWDVELVQKIELAARRRRSLPGLKTSVKKPLPPVELTC